MRLVIPLAAALMTVLPPGIALAAPDAEWTAYGRTPDEQRFSPLEQVNADNVGGLGLDWALDLPDAATLVSTPLMVNGVIYFSGDRAIVRAVDARTGKLLWVHDPQPWKHSPRGIAFGWNTNRGIAYEEGRIFVGATDGRVVALDAESGEVLWAARSFPVGERKAITGAPRAFDGKVFIGHGGAEFGTRGYLDAFDAATGERLGRFHTGPGDPANGCESPAMAMAAKTWSGRWWAEGGGGTVWHAITYDPDLDLIYLGVGNGGPWNRELRSDGIGDNLFLCSIVAVKADTGEYVWHYQVNPGEEWDYKATMDIVLADLEIDGEVRKVLMQAPTNGFYYVIERATGKLLSAEKYARVNWAERIDLETGRPVENPAARLKPGERFEMWPSPWGAHNWQAMSFNPRTGLAYIPTMHMPTTWMRGSELEGPPGHFRLGMILEHPTDPNASKGGLLAWDPVLQQARWSVEYDAVWNGGTLTTAGNLVMHGTASGELLAYDARDGRRLWSFFAQRGISAPPITYEIDGRQHFAVLVGWGGLASFGTAAFSKDGWKFKAPGIRLLSFSLEGRQRLPDVDLRRFSLTPVDTGSEPIDEASALRGLGLYHTIACATCHGGMAQSTGAAGPDLREAASTNDYRLFRSVVAEGALLPAGMPMFDELTESELRAIYDFLRQQTRAATPSAGR
ncbi:MAG: PQQ-dependent dehydrogenase, methanol/ethanol family [Steroidobacteraceae bacterium]